MGKQVGPLCLIAGIGTGAGLMYLLDPDRGRSRRARLRDETGSACRHVGALIAKARYDLANRTTGLIANTTSMLRHEPVDDDQLIARVRSKLGRVVSHPHAIDVTARGGQVTLRGAILEQEATHLIAAVSSVRGVSSVDDHLERHPDASNVPSLQGGRKSADDEAEFPEDRTASALRLLAGAAGGGLALYGLLSSRGAVKALALPFGLVLLNRGIASKSSGSLSYEYNRTDDRA